MRSDQTNANGGPPSLGNPPEPGLSGALERNIQALVEHRKRQSDMATRQERIAQSITSFAGSMAFIYIHAVLYGFWIIANLGWVPAVRPWDPSMVVLAMVASVEAIFLSTFVLISQNRFAAIADKRAELDLQIGLLAEHEITKLVALVSDIAKQLAVPVDQGELNEIEKDVAPEAVLSRLEETQEEA